MTAKNSIMGLIFFLVISNPVFSNAISPKEDGALHFSLENYEEAAALLEKALNDDPSDKSIVRILGLTYFNILEYEKALPLLHEALVTEPDEPSVQFALAHIYLGMLLLEEAGDSIDQLEKNQPDDWRTRMLRGRLCLAEDKNQCAISELTEAARLNPAIACLVNLDLVDLYVGKGELDKAEMVAKEGLKINPEAFEAVELRKKLDQLKSSGQEVARQKSYRVHLGYRLELDDYLLADKAAPVPLPEEDWRHVFSAGISGYRPLKNEKHLYGEARFYQSVHDEMSTFDQQQFYGLGGVRWVWGSYSFRVPVEYVWLGLDGDFYNSSLSLVPDIGFDLGGSNTLYALLRYQKDNYPDEVRAAEKRSGRKNMVGLMWMGPFSRQRGWAHSSMVMTETSGAGNNWNYDESRLTAGVTYQFSKNWRGKLTMLYGEQQYNEPHDIYLVHRNDRFFQWVPELLYRPLKQWSFKLHAILIDRDSSIADYSYDRFVLGMGMNFHY